MTWSGKISRDFADQTRWSRLGDQQFVFFLLYFLSFDSIGNQVFSVTCHFILLSNGEMAIQHRLLVLFLTINLCSGVCRKAKYSIRLILKKISYWLSDIDNFWAHWISNIIRNYLLNGIHRQRNINRLISGYSFIVMKLLNQSAYFLRVSF